MKRVLILSLLAMTFSLPIFAQTPVKVDKAQMSREMSVEKAQVEKTPRMMQGEIPKEKEKEMIMKMKREYIKKNLILTDQEAEKFWTIYDDYMKKVTEINKNFKASLEKEGIKREKGDVKETEMKPELFISYYDRKMKMKHEMLVLENSFYEQIKEVLTPENVMAYYKLEKDFKKEMAEMREKKRETPVPSQELKKSESARPADMPQRQRP